MNSAKLLWWVAVFFVVYLGILLYTGDLVWVGLEGKE